MISFIHMVRRLLKRIEIKGKIREIDRDIRAVEWERTIMLSQLNYKRAERMKAIIATLHKEKRELNQELKKW